MGIKKKKTSNIINECGNEISLKKLQCKEALKYKKKIEPRTETQKELIAAINNPNVEIIIVNGLAGCGKTFIVLSEVLNLLYNTQNKFEELYILKPVVSLEKEDIGFLPGDLLEKMQYIMMSYYDQMEKLIGSQKIDILFKQGILKVFPLGNIRGISMSDSRIVILDEVQNVSIKNTKTMLTRMEEGSKLILIGDISQSDSKKKRDNGLVFMTEKLNNIDDKIKVIKFSDEDVVRNPLIKKIQKIYEAEGY